MVKILRQPKPKSSEMFSKYIDNRGKEARKLKFEGLPINIRKRYTHKIGGYQLHVIWVYKCTQGNGKCGGPKHYTNLGFGPSIVKIKKGKYIDGAGKVYTLRDMFEIAEHNAFTRDSILCSPCWLKLHSINLLKNVQIKSITQIPHFNIANKPAIQEFNFKLPKSEGLKLMKEIYGKAINKNDYDILNKIATGKLHVNEEDKRHERIYVKYGKIIKYIDEQENKKRLEKLERISKKKREYRQKQEKKGLISQKLKRKIIEKTPPIERNKKISKKVKKALKNTENIDLK